MKQNSSISHSMWYIGKKRIESNFLQEDVPYYLQHVPSQRMITYEQHEGSDLQLRDFLRLTRPSETGTPILLEKVSTGSGCFDFLFRIKLLRSSHSQRSYITNNTIGRLYLHLDTLECATLWHMKTTSPDISTHLTCINSTTLPAHWHIKQKYQRKWVLTHAKKFSDLTPQEQWIFFPVTNNRVHA